jgi:hypothetical protein
VSIGTSVNIDQLALSLIEFHIQECRNSGQKIDGIKLRSLHPEFVERLRDFICVLKFGQSHQDLLAEGDSGIIKVIQLFGVSATAVDGIVQERCKVASLDGDREFLSKVDDALKRQRQIDGRIKGDNLFIKAFLFLNWETPFLFVDTPLRLWTNRQILECLEEFFASKTETIEWDEGRFKKELHLLGLKRR